MTDNLTLQATERVMKARAELILTRKRTFYGVLVGQVTPIASSKYPTMATNGKQHFFNPRFIMGLKKNHLGKETSPQNLVVGVQAHETEHDARRHHTRRGGRDPMKWNEATDYAINIDLIDEGFELPEGALIDEKYRGMSAEDIYRSREIDEELERQKQQQESDDDESDDEADDEAADSDPGTDEGDDDEGDNADDPGDDDGDAEGDDAGDDEAEGEGEDADDDGDEGGSEGEGDDEGEDGEGGNADDGEPEDGDDATGEGEGEAEGDGEGEGEGTGEGSGDADGEADGQGEPQSSGDPGQCGEVLDAADEPAELAEEDAKWDRYVQQAAKLAAKRGTVPGHVARAIETADHPPQDWRETLRAFFDGGAQSIETWNRPNRRFIASGIYLPGREREGVNKVVFLIDTSGSVTYYPGALEAIKVETAAALDEGFIDECVVLYGDTRVTRVDTYRKGDEIEFDPRGGGGTVMKPLFDYVATEIDDASLIVAFTDLEIEPEDQLGPVPHCPVLWAVVGYPENVKKYLEVTPWGAPGIEVRP
jgi:predicted metal-dependent peptidase